MHLADQASVKGSMTTAHCVTEFADIQSVSYISYCLHKPMIAKLSAARIFEEKHGMINECLSVTKSYTISEFPIGP